MTTRCQRRGQGEIGIITHDGRVFTAFGSSVYGHNLTAYTGRHEGRTALVSWCGRIKLSCRSEVVRRHHDGSLALVFRLTRRRYLVGYALGDEGMLFRGELLIECDDARARHEALELADYWSEIDARDEADPWHGATEPDEPQDW